MKVTLHAISFLSVFLIATAALAADPTGTWRWEHPDENAPGKMIPDILHLHYDGETVTGNYEAPSGQVPIENPSMTDDELYWELNIPGPEGTLELAWKGKVVGSTVTGTVKFGDFGEFPWVAQRDVNPTGTWRWEHEDLEGSGEMIPDVLHLTYLEGKVTGTYETPDASLPIEKATMKGDTLHWELNLDTPDGNLNLAWTGKISNDEVNGTIKFGDFGEFPWEAKRDAAVEPDKWQLTIEDSDGATEEAILYITEIDGQFTAKYESGGMTIDVENFEANAVGQFSFEVNVPDMGITSKFIGTADAGVASGNITYTFNGEEGERTFNAEQVFD